MNDRRGLNVEPTTIKKSASLFEITMKLSVVAVLSSLSIASAASYNSNGFAGVRRSLFAVRGGGLFGGGNKEETK